MNMLISDCYVASKSDHAYPHDVILSGAKDLAKHHGAPCAGPLFSQNLCTSVVSERFLSRNRGIGMTG